LGLEFRLHGHPAGHGDEAAQGRGTLQSAVDPNPLRKRVADEHEDDDQYKEHGRGLHGARTSDITYRSFTERGIPTTVPHRCYLQ